ncbi:hypothetical protein GCM10020254_73490 [Streptomyces goshikiensis]
MSRAPAGRVRSSFPPSPPEVLAEAVESLSGRLRKKLDAAIEGCAAGAVRAADGSVGVRFGEDAVVTLRPGPSGVVTEADQAVCGCLLAPRCLHRAAVLGASPIADPQEPAPPGPGARPGDGARGSRRARCGARGIRGAHGDDGGPRGGRACGGRGGGGRGRRGLTAAQVRAAAGLWEAAAEALAAGG